MTKNSNLPLIRALLLLFIVGLLLSGITAFPLETELKIVTDLVGANGFAQHIGLTDWLLKVREGLVETNAKYPFIAYGTDWLAFAHIVIAIAFIGPLRDPVKNIWVIEFGMIACVLVIPLALIAGPIRGIPFGWTLIDCSFGVFGIIPLWLCWRLIKREAS
ncbi:hypothetical protein BH09VER1_BH09VER1_33480 [soil metagenome]